MKVIQITSFNGKISALVNEHDPIPVKNIEGTAHKGDILEEIEKDKYRVIGSNVNEDCVNGVCPIR